MSGRRIQAIVADTSALVSLGVPRATDEYDTAIAPDPLQYVLTSCSVTIPTEVFDELEAITHYQDIHAAAATNVLAARDHYTVEDPYQRSDTPDSRPTIGLDDGETDGIVLANDRDADAFLTDEFAGTNFALVHAGLDGPRIIPAPRLIVDYARNGHMTHEEARTLIETISAHRSWANNPYVTHLLAQLD